MVSGDNVEVTLTGGAPWGFRLTGGAALPLEIAKIRKKSQAHAQGLREGDAVVSINGTPVHDLSHDQAVDLIDGAGDTLTLQIYRGDADDLMQLLANNKPQATLAPPGLSGTVTSSASSTAMYDDGVTRGTVQQEVSVLQGGDNETSTFVRREQRSTVTTSTTGGDVNGNDIIRLDVLPPGVEMSNSTQGESGETSTSTSRTSSLQISSSVHVTSSSSSIAGNEQQQHQQVHRVQLQPVQQEQPQVRRTSPIPVPKGPTFKAVPPKVAPQVAPKPSRGPPVAPKPGSAPSMFSPTKFQVSATAMYAPSPPQPYTPATPKAYTPATPKPFSATKKAPAFSTGPQPYSPVTTTLQPAAFSPTPQPPQLFSPGSQAAFSSGGMSSPGASQPFSPMSPGNAPMFSVRNNVGGGATVWTANMWLPGQEPQPKQQQQQQPHQQQQQYVSEDVEVPKHMSIKERQQQLLQQTSRTHHSLQARQADPHFDAPSEEEQRTNALKLRVFAPPVEMTPWGPEPHHPEYLMGDSAESGNSSPTSSFIRRKKKMYADSAFYEDAQHKYPTIDEQMKLCRLISKSLTSAANKKARGAKMFAKRKKRSTKWVHEAHSEWSSSAGDVANINELDSELSPDEGGNKPLFYFRIPNLKHRVGSPERNTKMAMKKDEFERLRLQSSKCDHTAVSPGQCFDIVADLKASKGRGGRLFERRKNRADKFIVDESNARKAGPKPTRLEDLLTTPLKSRQSPWEAAQEGNVDAAFDHLTDRERMQKLNQILKYSPPKPQPVKQDLMEPLTKPYSGPRADLRGYTLSRLEGRNFNRLARGWQSQADDNHERAPSVPHVPAFPDAPVQGGSLPRGSRMQYGDYNPRPKAWQSPTQGGGDAWSCPASMSASWASSDFDAYHTNGYGAHTLDDHCLPACDL